MSDLDFDFVPPTAGGVPSENTAARVADPSADTGEDEFDRSLRPKTLDDFLGQARVREQLRVFIDAARGREEALDHALFAGPPGLGKCITPDSILFTNSGMIPIGSLGDLEGESWQPITKPVAGLYGMRTADYFYNNGVGATLRVTTRAGYRVEGTPNHPVLVRDGGGRLEFRHLSELKSGDEVAIRLGARVFGSSTQLHVEGVKAPTLSDPAVVPSNLTGDVARLLGLLLVDGRMSPGGDGIVVTTRSREREREIDALCTEELCLILDDFGEGPFGRRLGQRSPRVASFLRGLGLTRDGFDCIPAPIYRAPSTVVAEFMRGVFFGSEDAPTCTFADRRIVAHLQLMLANFGIESAISMGERGYRLDVVEEPPVYQSYNVDSGGDHYNAPVAGPSISSNPTGGFGMAPAARQDIQVLPRPMAVEAPPTISVAEVEPTERGRALVRDRLHLSDGRALAVRSVSAPLKSDEVVELAWEAVASIEPGYAHTCDVSVPDGHSFIGNGIVCHNTTLASVVANELGTTMHQTSGPALERKADVAAILTSLQPRDVLFIDEIHRLNTAVEEVLYSAMEDYQLDIVLGQGPSARTLRLDVAPFTLVGATTRTGLLTTPLRDRFGIVQRLEHYNVDELRSIVERSAQLLEIEIDDQASVEIAMRSRGTPRIANRLLKRVRDVAEVRHDGNVTLEVAREALDLVDIDGAGLDRLDRAVLETIARTFSGGPVGLSTLSVALGEEAHTLEDVYEPYLLQRGLIQRTPRGRIITERGYEHIGGRPTGAGKSLF
jgi:Holliday junction DNA helicase RuvB